MKCYSAPYEGDGDYIVLSFCRADTARAYAIIERLCIEGFRVWYDDGLPGGEKRRETVAAHLDRACGMAAVISVSSVDSHACRDMINDAALSGKDIVSVFVEEAPMTVGMARQLSGHPCIRAYEMPDAEAFFTALMGIPVLEKCRGENSGAGETELAAWRLHEEEYRRSWDEEEAERRRRRIEKERRDRERRERSAEYRARQRGLADDDSADDEDTIIDDEDTLPGENGEPFEPWSPAVLYRKSTGEIFSLERKQAVIGRGQGQVDVLVLGNRQISRRHAEIFQHNGKLFIRDLDSTHGTLVDGEPVSSTRERELNDIALLSMGDEEFLAISGPVFAPLSREREIGLLQSVRTGEIRLIAGGRFYLDRSHTWPGDVLGSRRISRHNQTEIIRTETGFAVEDLNSPNGTFLNGKRISGRAEKLSEGDRISAAEEEFIFSRIVLADDDRTVRDEDYTLR